MIVARSVLGVDLEVLDAAGQVLACVPAQLRYMDGDCALVHVSGPARMMWGNPVRFVLEDGCAAFHLEGVVAGHLPLEGGGKCPSIQEVRLRLTDCRENEQRRITPRRRVRFSVRYRTIADGAVGTVFEEDDAIWHEGMAMDLGAGGMRIKAGAEVAATTRLAVEFRLAPSEVEDYIYRLVGRVLRSEASGRRGMREVALKFESLPVEAGLSLSAFLCR